MVERSEVNQVVNAAYAKKSSRRLAVSIVADVGMKKKYLVLAFAECRGGK